MENHQFKLSKYCRLVSLRAKGQDTYLIYSGLSGKVCIVDKGVADTIASALAHDGCTIDVAGLPDTILPRLTASKILLDKEADEETTIRNFDTVLSALRGGAKQFLILPDRTEITGKQLYQRAELIFDTIDALIGDDAPDSLTLYFWYLDPRQLEPLDALFKVYDQWLTMHSALMPHITTVLNTSCLYPLAVDAYPSLQKTKSIFCVFTDEMYEHEFTSLEAYVDQVARNMLSAGESGIVSYLHMYVHRENANKYLDQAFPLFMMRGVFYTIITTFNLLPIHKRSRRRELFCAYHGQDAELAIQLRSLMSTRERYRLFTMRGGINSELEECLQRKANSILPDNSACPILPNGYVLTLSGSLWTCPVLASDPSLDPCGHIGRFIPSLWVDEEKLRQWRQRVSSRMNPCRECPDCLLCRGGCPYDAIRAGRHFDEPFCESVSDAIAAAAGYDLDAFNPLEAEDYR